jgi:hypothetical protein
LRLLRLAGRLRLDNRRPPVGKWYFIDDAEDDFAAVVLLGDKDGVCPGDWERRLGGVAIG